MGIKSITLKREGGENDPLAQAVVSVEIDGQSIEVIRELASNNFDHTVYLENLPSWREG